MISPLAVTSPVVIPAKAGTQFGRICVLPKASAGMLDMDKVRRYFALLDREDLLEALTDGR